ncbi:GntR family carbon starvation induced transcriptional regulator [Bradyrhizobium sp. F1.13.1]
MSESAIRPRKEFGKTVAADITHRLREEIIACGLAPGEPLRFDVLRERFGVSFTTLREALTALTAEGLVDAQEQRGFRVAPVSRQDLVEVTDARVLIEVELIRRAIERGDDDWEIAVISTLHRLKRIEQRDPEHPLRDPEWKIAHRQFHQALVSACGSATLLAIRAPICSIAPSAIGICWPISGRAHVTRPASTRRSCRPPSRAIRISRCN